MAGENDSDHDNVPVEEELHRPESTAMFSLKLLAASVLFFSAFTTYTGRVSNLESQRHRRLLEAAIGDSIPTYIEPLMKDLRERKKLMEETPPEEVKYWFEYTGPLQVSCPVFAHSENSIEDALQ